VQHAKTFVMASLPPAPDPDVPKAVSDQTSAVTDGHGPPPPTPELQLTIHAPPTPAREADALFDALGDPVRRRLLVTLCATGGAYVSTLCQRVGLPRNIVSRHLGHLRMRGLVLDRREGQHIWYAPAEGFVRYETRDGRYTLTIRYPSGEGLSVFGAVAGVMGKMPAAPVPTAEGTKVG
jgi:DNA-binding transcriptional ArsR family regulator